jgi:hypothetical protein
MDLSSEIIKKCIEPGAVLYFVNPNFKSTKPHFYVVLNNTPDADIILIMVNFTSNIDYRKRRRHRLPPASLVELSNSDCPFLDKPSIIDCNSPTYMTMDEVVDKNVKGELRLISTINDSILALLRAGVIASPMVVRGMKRLVK